MRGAPLEAILWGVVGMRKRMGIEPLENTFLDEGLPDHSPGCVPSASV